MKPLAAILLFVGACARTPTPAATPATPRAPLPELDAPGFAGLPLWDHPIDEAPEPVLRFWGHVDAAVHDRAPRPGALTREVYAVWIREEFRPWLSERVAGHSHLVREAGAMRSELTDPSLRLFVALSLAAATESLLREVGALPVPEGLDTEQRTIFRDALASSLAPLGASLGNYYRACAELSFAHGPLDAWPARCEDRLAEVARTYAQPPPRSTTSATTPGRDAWPAACAVGPAPPADAPPPDMSAAREFAVVGAGQLPVEARERVLGRLGAIVASRVDGARLIPVAEVMEAQRLRDARRWSADAAACAQAPPLAALLQPRHPNLVLARVSLSCRPDCSLWVSFDRAGTDAYAGLPGSFTLPMSGDPDDPASWLDATAHPERAEELAGVIGMLRDERSPRVIPSGELDPLLDVPRTIAAERARFHACVPEGVAVAEVTLTISDTGETSAASVSGVDEPTRRCLEAALAEVSWRCSRTGRPADVRLRMCVR